MSQGKLNSIVIVCLSYTLIIVLGTVIPLISTFPSISAKTLPNAHHEDLALSQSSSATYTIYLPFFEKSRSIVRLSLAPEGGSFVDCFAFVSTGGRYTAFGNRRLIPTARPQEVYVYDSQTRQNELVSVASDGSLANGFSFAKSISQDGRYVLFTSEASNLVSGDTNGERDAFVRDRQTGQTTRVSVASDGSQADVGTSIGSISADGRYVAFATRAYNLVNNDTNGWFDIFVHDRQTGQTTRVSVASDGTQANKNSDYPSISANGRYVAFESDASNLVDNDTNCTNDIFVHDLQTQQTYLISIAHDGNPANAGSYDPSISADGRYVAFASAASNLVNDNDTNNSADVFVHDRQIAQTRRVSVDLNGNPVTDYPYVFSGSYSPSISADGRYVAFQSSASDLVAGDTNNHEDIFVRDLQTNRTYLISLTYDGNQANANSFYPDISADGRYVAFGSYASNLVVDDDNGTLCDPFLTDW